MNKIEIIACDGDDLAALKRISIQTFTDTFGEYNSAEDMNQFLTEAYNDDKLAKEIDDVNSQFYLAKVDGDIAAYTKLNVSEDTFELERIYVDKNYQKFGLGKLLMDHAISVAKLSKCSNITLGVWEHNDNALAFYQKMGFERTGEHVFMVGKDKQIDFIYTKKLK